MRGIVTKFDMLMYGPRTMTYKKGGGTMPHGGLLIKQN